MTMYDKKFVKPYFLFYRHSKVRDDCA